MRKLLRTQDFFPRDPRTFKRCLSAFSEQKEENSFKNTLYALANIFSLLQEPRFRGQALENALLHLNEVSENEVHLAKHLITSSSMNHDMILIKNIIHTLLFIKELQQDDTLEAAVKLAGEFKLINLQPYMNSYKKEKNIIDSLKILEKKASSLQMQSNDILRLFKDCGILSNHTLIDIALDEISELGLAIKQAWGFKLLDQKTDKPDSSQGVKFSSNENLPLGEEGQARRNIIEFLKKLDKLNLKEDRIEFAQTHRLIDISTSWTADLSVLKFLQCFKDETLKVGEKFSLMNNPKTALSYLRVVNENPQLAEKILQGFQGEIDTNESPYENDFWDLVHPK